jgi:plastocyanin
MTGSISPDRTHESRTARGARAKHAPKVLTSFLLLFLFRSGALAAPTPVVQQGHYYLPSGAATEILTVTKTGNADEDITVLTQAVAVKETGPKETVDTFGEVYAFSPTLIAVHRDQPTEIDFWNLQPDDEHDLALMGSDLKILMYVKLPPLKKTAFIFTFHKEGLIDFKCMLHQPEMSGQILVLPPQSH